MHEQIVYLMRLEAASLRGVALSSKSNEEVHKIEYINSG